MKYPEPARFNITVCFACVHSKYNAIMETIQTIEMDQILGIEHFVVYNFSIGNDVEQVLRYYSNQGILDVNTWNLPNMQIHYYGQLAAINDCIYSNRGKSKYVIVKDFDEIFVPYKDQNLLTLISRTMERKPLAASLTFHNTFFNKKWPDDIISFKSGLRAKQFGLYILMKIWRENYIWPRNRKKSIVIPERIYTSGIHTPLEIRHGFVKDTIQPKEGLMHHYKNIDKEDNSKGRKREDFLRVYSGILINRFNRTFSRVRFNSKISKTQQ